MSNITVTMPLAEYEGLLVANDIVYDKVKSDWIRYDNYYGYWYKVSQKEIVELIDSDKREIIYLRDEVDKLNRLLKAKKKDSFIDYLKRIL